MFVNTNYYRDDGLSGIGSFFKKIGVGLGRVFSGGLWDPGKNRFYVPFSSGHMRTFGKGLTTTLTGGFVNADKFFDTRTMRTIGTVTGVATGVVAGGALASAGGFSSIGSAITSVGSKVGSVLPSLSTASNIFGVARLGMGLFGGGGNIMQEQQIEQPVEQVVQTNYPTLVNPISSYSLYPNQYVLPYSYNPYPGQGYYQYGDSSRVELVQSPSIQSHVEVVTQRSSILPGGVEVITLSGEDDMVDSFGNSIKYY